jgi:hypothetical protein
MRKDTTNSFNKVWRNREGGREGGGGDYSLI